MNKKSILITLGASVGALVLIGSSAGAASLITSKQIKDNTIRSVDIRNGGVHEVDLSQGVRNKLNAKTQYCWIGTKGITSCSTSGPKGDKGDAGAKGDNGLVQAYYAVAKYDVGDTNAGAIATVACKDQGDVAISGGAQVLGLDADANSRNTPVSSSFPGRMDWSTNTPKADRLDGWIVQFGGNAGAVSDKSPEKVNVWAFCVPGAQVTTQTTYVQSQD